MARRLSAPDRRVGAAIGRALAERPDNARVARFVPGSGMQRLPARVDLAQLREALAEVPATRGCSGDRMDAMSLTRKAGHPDSALAQRNRSGLHWTRSDASYREQRFEGGVRESELTELVPEHAHTCFKHVYDTLSRKRASVACGF